MIEKELLDRSYCIEIIVVSKWILYLHGNDLLIIFQVRV